MIPREALVAKLQPYPKLLRADASGEAGRMPATEMYTLADLLDAALAALVSSPSREEERRREAGL